MPTLAGTVFGLLAAASVNGDAAATAFFVQRGFSAISRNGVGDYTLTLTDGAALSTEAVVIATPNAASAGMVAVEPLTTTTMRVRNAGNTGAAAENDFWIEVQKIAP